MKKLLFGATVGVLFSCSSYAADWMLRVQTSSRTCHVQLKTAAPLGTDMSGPFSSRKEACQAASDAFDSSFTDPTKCWTYGGGTVDGCEQDGVHLPKK
jgi:hypothetical protein